MSIKIGNNGRIIFSAFLGPYSSYPEGSEEWHVAFSRSVQSEFDRMQFANPKGFATLLVKAVNTDYRPWEHWPEEAKGNPDKYFRLVIGCSWAEARQVVIGQGGEEGMQWVRVIDGALQEWRPSSGGTEEIGATSVTRTMLLRIGSPPEVSAAAFKSELLQVTIKLRQSSPSSPLVNFPQTQQQSKQA